MPGTASVAPIFYQPTKFYKIVLKMTWLGEIGNIGILLKIWEKIWNWSKNSVKND